MIRRRLHQHINSRIVLPRTQSVYRRSTYSFCRLSSWPSVPIQTAMTSDQLKPYEFEYYQLKVHQQRQLQPLNTQTHTAAAAVLIHYPFDSADDALLATALSRVSERLYVELFSDAWANKTLNDVQKRLNVLYHFAATKQPDVDCIILLPTTAAMDSASMRLISYAIANASDHVVVVPDSCQTIITAFKQVAVINRTLQPIDVVSLTAGTDTVVVLPSSEKITKITPSLLPTSSTPSQESQALQNAASLCAYNHVACGGTFDRLHMGHKMLLSTAAIMAQDSVTVGVTSPSMLHRKQLSELIQPIQYRMTNVKKFLDVIRGGLECHVVELHDPAGPAATDATIDSIVVSNETEPAVAKINQTRHSSALKPLAVIKVPDIQSAIAQSVSSSSAQSDAAQLQSSTSARFKLVGQYLGLSHPAPWKKPPRQPYVIGLTGGIASGKSGIRGHLESLGAAAIDCDKVAYSVYDPGQPAFQQIVETFGPSVVNDDGTINRRVLGGIVFASKDKLQQLNAIVWPTLREKVIAKLEELGQTHTVVCMEAAVLIDAKWHTDGLCDEVWVCNVPRAEAIRRLQERNGLSEDESVKRIDSQMSNEERIKYADVFFTSTQPVQVTRSFVELAWNELQRRIQLRNEFNRDK